MERSHIILLCCAGMISWGYLGTGGGFMYGITLLCRNDKLGYLGAGGEFTYGITLLCRNDTM